jgi:putative endonuclease
MARMARARVRLGQIGEDLACAELERRGYVVLARRYRRRSGEIDIIATDRGTLVFVEVKARDGGSCGLPAEAVTGLKRQRLVATARDYLARHPAHDRPCRFDVVAVYVGEAGPVVELFPNAFDATG